MADDVQSPDGDQGDAASPDSGGLYPDLDSVSPEVRAILEPHIKEIQGNVEKKFRESAEYRKGWSPYEELGINQIDPQELQELLTFANMANDPAQADQFNQWLAQVGQERGVFGNQAEEPDLGLEGVEDLSTEKVQELIAEQVAANLSPIQETLQAQEQARLEQEANQEINSQLEQIRKDNPNLPKNAEHAIVRFAYSYADEGDDPIQKGFAEYMETIGQGEKNLFAQKASQPSPTEGGGAANTTPEKMSNAFGDPTRKAVAEEMLRKAHNS